MGNIEFTEIIRNIYSGNTMQQWALFLFQIMLAVVAARILNKTIQYLAVSVDIFRRLKLFQFFAKCIRRPLIFVGFLYGLQYSLNILILPEMLAEKTEQVIFFLFIVSVAGFCANYLASLHREYLLPIAEKSKNNVDDVLLILFGASVQIIVWGFGLALGFKYTDYRMVLGDLAVVVYVQELVAYTTEFLTAVDQVYYGNTIWQWYLFIVILTTFLIFSRVASWGVKYWIEKQAENQKSKFLKIVVENLGNPVSWIILLFGVRFAFSVLVIPEMLAERIEHVIMFVFALIVTYLSVNLFQSFYEEYFVFKLKSSKAVKDDALLELLGTIAKILIWGVGIMIALTNAGFDIGAILAGLGIGGLAVAMAAQDSLANLFGGIMVFIQKPFRIGDRIKVQGLEGWVIKLGLRSTTIRNFFGHTYIVPNKTFVDNAIENVDTRPCYYITQTFRLHSAMSAGQVRRAMKILDEQAVNTANVGKQTWVNFAGPGDFYFEIEFWFSVDIWKPEEKDIWADFYLKMIETQSEVNLNILEAFEAEGIRLAMPVQLLQNPVADVGKVFGPLVASVPPGAG